MTAASLVFAPYATVRSCVRRDTPTLINRPGEIALQVATALVVAMDDLTAPSLPEWMLQELPVRIESLLNLEDDWDSYGGVRISSKVGESVFQLLLHTQTAEPPTIEPNPSGIVIVEWENKTDDYVSVGVGEDQALVEFDVNGEEGEFELFGKTERRKLNELVRVIA